MNPKQYPRLDIRRLQVPGFAPAWRVQVLRGLGRVVETWWSANHPDACEAASRMWSDRASRTSR